MVFPLQIMLPLRSYLVCGRSPARFLRLISQGVSPCPVRRIVLTTEYSVVYQKARCAFLSGCCFQGLGQTRDHVHVPAAGAGHDQPAGCLGHASFRPFQIGDLLVVRHQQKRLPAPEAADVFEVQRRPVRLLRLEKLEFDHISVSSVLRSRARQRPGSAARGGKCPRTSGFPGGGNSAAVPCHRRGA